MPCDFPCVDTGLALTGHVDCPRASCDLVIKYVMLRSHAGDPRSPARKTWGAIGVCGPWEVRTKSCSCDATVTCVLPVLCVFLRFLAQYSMEPYVYPTEFGRCPFGCSAGPCRRPTGFGTTYGQSCRPVWGKYRACRTHIYGSFWTTHGSLRADNRRKPISESCTCSSSSHGLYGPIRVQKSSKHRTNPQRGHPPSMTRIFAVANKDTKLLHTNSGV